MANLDNLPLNSYILDDTFMIKNRSNIIKIWFFFHMLFPSHNALFTQVSRRDGFTSLGGYVILPQSSKIFLSLNSNNFGSKCMFNVNYCCCPKFVDIIYWFVHINIVTCLIFDCVISPVFWEEHKCSDLAHLSWSTCKQEIRIQLAMFYSHHTLHKSM